VEKQLLAIKNNKLAGLQTFSSNMAHEGPLSTKHYCYKGSCWNILVEWEGEEATWEPLNIIAKDNPISSAMYGEKNILLDKKGWKWLKKHPQEQSTHECKL
jgi:hypothetical protein